MTLGSFRHKRRIIATGQASGRKLTEPYFAAVADYLGYSAASRHLHVHQPAISQTILDFEEEIGAKLFAPKKRRCLQLLSPTIAVRGADEFCGGWPNGRAARTRSRTAAASAYADQDGTSDKLIRSESSLLAPLPGPNPDRAALANQTALLSAQGDLSFC